MPRVAGAAEIWEADLAPSIAVIGHALLPSFNSGAPFLEGTIL
jgi:hypothetical protein